MSKQEILCTPYGEMMDMMACMAIENGSLKQIPPKRVWNYDEAIALR